MPGRKKSTRKLSLIIEIADNKANLIQMLNITNYDSSPDEKGNTALHQLALVGIDRMADEEVIEALNYLLELNYPIDLNTRNFDGKTALSLAVKNHRFGMAEILVRKSVAIDIDMADDNNIFNSLSIARYIYSHKHSPWDKELFSKILTDINSLCKTLFTKVDINQRDIQNNSLLQQAILKKHFQLAKFFIEFGAEVNNCNSNGFTALELAAAEPGWLELILLLLTKDVKIEKSLQYAEHIFNTVEDVFSFALFSAVKDGEVNIVSQTLDYAAQLGEGFKHKIINQLNEEGLTPLHIATKGAMKKLITILINAGADINKPSSENIKPLFMVLHCNCETSSLEIIGTYLNTKKCDVNDTNPDGRTLLHNYCFMPYFHYVIEFLLKVSADVNKQDNDGNTPLHIAADKGNYHHVEILLNAGAFCIKNNKARRKPLDHAISAYFETKAKLANLSMSSICEFERAAINYKEDLSNYYKIIEQLLDAGAGIYIDCSMKIPADIKMDGKIVIGLTMLSHPVSRTTHGFENAITNYDELKSAIRKGIKLGRKKLIAFCSARIMDQEEINKQENLKELRATLYQLTPDSLVNLCLNVLNNSSASFFRQMGIHQDSELPPHFKEKLNPDMIEIVSDKSNSVSLI